MSIRKISKLMIALVLLASIVFTLCSCGSPEAKFEKAQKKEISELLDSLLANYSNVELPEEMTVDSKMKVTLDAPLLSSLKANTGISFDWIKDLSIDLTTAMNGSGFAVDADLAYNNKALVAISALLDMEKGNAYVQIPQLAEKYLGISLGIIPGADMTDSLNQMPSPETLKTIVNRYVDIVFDQLPEITVENGELKIDGISESCKVYTVKFTQEAALNLGKTLLETVKDDADIKTFIMDRYEFQTGGNAFEDYTAEDAYNDFQEEISDMIADIDDYKKTLKEDELSANYATWTSYMKKSEIIGNKIAIPDDEFEFFCGTAHEKSDSRFDCYLTTSDGKIFSITGDLVENKNKLSGELELSVNEESICFIGLENFDTEILKEGYINGTITVSPSKGAMDFIRNIVSQEYATFISTCSLKFDVASTKNNSDVTISLMSGNEPYFSLNVVSNVKESAQINVPSESQTIFDIDQWAESLDPEKVEDLLETIKNSGLPSEIVDLILGSIQPE